MISFVEEGGYMEAQEYTADYWKDKYEASETRRLELEALVLYYEEQFRLYKHRQFGASSEKTPIADQLCLFGEYVDEQTAVGAEEKYEVITYKRRKARRKRADDFSRLSVDCINVHEIPEGERICPKCGGPAHKITTIIHKTVKIIPAKAVIAEDHQDVYGCRNCEKNSDSVPIINAQCQSL